MNTIIILLFLLVAAAIPPAVLYVLYRSPLMRTASQRKIERETAEIQRQVPDACPPCNHNCNQGRNCPAKLHAGCDVEQFAKSRTVSRDWARANARKAARQEELTGAVPVNPYNHSDPEYVEWAVELAQYRTELHYAQSKFQTPV